MTVPPDLPPAELTVEKAGELLAQASQGDQVVGTDPETGKPVYVKNGRFGPYVQLGDAERTDKGVLKKGGKPKMASVWPSMNPETLTLDDALLLLSFPKTLGEHPETKEPITVQDGKYGPYVKAGKRNPEPRKPRADGFDHPGKGPRTSRPRPKGRRGQQASSAAIEIGVHPQSGLALKLKDGRFGPYVTDGEVNASLPKWPRPQPGECRKGGRTHRRPGRQAPSPRQRPPSQGEKEKGRQKENDQEEDRDPQVDQVDPITPRP